MPVLRKIEVKPNKTYATAANAEAAVKKRFGQPSNLPVTTLNYFITCTPEGRYFPVFIGAEALRAGVHFHFNVVG